MNKIAYFFFFTTIAIAISLFAGIRSSEQVASIQTPDSKHFHQVYGDTPLYAEFKSNAQGLSGVSIAIRPGISLPQAKIMQVEGEKEIPSFTTITGDTIRISFDPLPQSHNKSFRITIKNSDAPKEKALFVPYESDESKYADNQVWQGDIKKQGSLGIAQYEKPTYALVFVRWLTLPYQKPLWLGAVLIFAYFIVKIIPHKQNPYALPNNHIAYYIGIFLVIITMYWPATKMSFLVDDLPIIARVAVLWQNHAWQIFTPLNYVEPDTRAGFVFYFWRPVTFALYPLILHLLIPPIASLYYLLNIIFLAITGCLLFNISKLIGLSNIASLLSVALWASHSSKIGVIYWWSSVQDILASLFAMATIVLYFRWKSSLKSIYWYVMLATYSLSILSKEYVAVVPIVIACMEFFLAKQPNSLNFWKQTLRSLSPFFVVTGVFLILNTTILNSSRLVSFQPNDRQYSLHIQPRIIAKNIISYLSISIESPVWTPQTKTIPTYPGILTIAGTLVLFFLFIKQPTNQNRIILGCMWWTMFLGPILLFPNDFRSRWLTLSIFGIGIIVATVAQSLEKYGKIISRVILPISICITIAYGYYIMRSDSQTRFYKEQTAYMQNAQTQLREQEKQTSAEYRIILVGVIKEQLSSLTAYFFRIYAKNPQAEILYSDTEPSEKLPGDIIINMSGIIPYDAGRVL